MDRRRSLALIAAGVVALGGGGTALLLGGGDDDNPRRVAVGDPIAFMPASADAIFDIDLSVPLPAVAFAQLLPADLRAELPKRGRAAAAFVGGRRWLAFQGRDRLVTVGARPARRATRAAFERRVARLPRDAGARVAFRPRALLARFSAGVAGTRWARSLRDGVAAIVVRANTVVVPFRLTGPSPPGALPIAPGATPPRPRGRAPIVVGLRDPARMLRFAREAGLFSELDVLDSLPGFLRPDLKRLGAEGTLTSDGRGAVTIRTQPPDPGDWRRKLNRFDALSGLARRLGIADVRIDREGDAYRVEQNDTFALRIGVFGAALVLSNSEHADLAAAARAAPARAPAGAAGGLAATVAPDLVLDLLSERLGTSIPRDIFKVSPLSGWLRVEPAQATGELRMSLS